MYLVVPKTATKVLAAGKQAGEKLWQWPLDKEYRAHIKCDRANIKPVSERHFIREFVEDTLWVHLDIAGTAWNVSNKAYLSVGPTGVCVRTLVNLVCD
ncbi:MAG: hypothetical protein M3X11_25700 [Acidobacteriota bacterium]|nr:hypothetical protein [Acidobacteriota bacterium]